MIWANNLDFWKTEKNMRGKFWLYLMEINDMGAIVEFWQNQVLGKYGQLLGIAKTDYWKMKS